MKDDFGNRIKQYESQTNQRLIYRLPFVVRIDGCNFSRFTKGFERPYDHDLRKAMIGGVKNIINKTHAIIGYTQSDEANFVYKEQDDPFMGGRVSKICSELPQMFLWGFLNNANKKIYDKAIKLGISFDCRVFNVPSRMEAVNCILWREQDATKNSIQMLARCYFSHKQLENINTRQMQDMLMLEHDINWNDQDVNFKRDTYLQRKLIEKQFTQEELQDLPPKHQAHKNPDMVFIRSEIQVLGMPPLAKVINRVNVFFDGENPLTE